MRRRRNRSPISIAARTVNLIVGYSAGGGYDTYARMLARHLGKHIPGNPSIVVQNMPGAGSLKLANYLYNVAPKDGTTIGTFSRGMAMEPLIGGSERSVRRDEVHLARQRHRTRPACSSPGTPRR